MKKQNKMNGGFTMDVRGFTNGLSMVRSKGFSKVRSFRRSYSSSTIGSTILFLKARFVSLNNNPKYYSIINETPIVLNPFLQGIFIIKHTNINTDRAKTLFMFLDYRSHKITKYLVYSGKSHYKVYGEFIYNTLTEISKGLIYTDCLDKYVLVPGYYVNCKIKKNVKLLTGLSMKTYTLKSDNLPNILSYTHKAINMDSIDFDEDISNINLLLSYEYNMVDIHKFNNISNQKRSYSTDNYKKTPQDDTNIDKSVFQTLGLDPSKIHIQKVCMIENKPII